MMKRLALAGCAAALALAAPGAFAQTGSLTGSWAAVAMGVTFRLVVQPNGAYSETEQKGQLMTMQQGVIQSAGPSMIAFVVQDWAPRTMPVRQPPAGYVQAPTSKPPGGLWRVRFNSPNSVTLQDANLGGVVTFQRVG